MKYVKPFPFIIIINKYFSSSSPSSMNVKIVFWLIVETVDKEGWMNGFNFEKFKFQ